MSGLIEYILVYSDNDLEWTDFQKERIESLQSDMTGLLQSTINRGQEKEAFIVRQMTNDINTLYNYIKKKGREHE